MATTMKNAQKVHIRYMTKNDISGVLQIEQLSFINYSWNKKDFLRCLGWHNYINMVAQDDKTEIVGFMIYEMHENELHLINFAVHPERRLKSIGTQMVAKVIDSLSKSRRKLIALKVRETNLAAQLFFRSQGFKATSVLPAFYKDSGEDAFLMEYRLDSDNC